MPKSQKGHIYILCVIDEVTIFLITVPIFQARSEEVYTPFAYHIKYHFLSFSNCLLYVFCCGGPSAKVSFAANGGGLVFKASLFYYPGGPSAKV